MHKDASQESPRDDAETAETLRTAYGVVRREVAKVIVGQDDVVEQILICVLASGHAILEGVPGLAKTLMVRTLARALSLRFSRIQFTPDLMPGDITGTEVIEEDRSTGTRAIRFVRGPIFANVILADEINRTPPKTQAALLEAMQEHQVTAGGETHALPAPFLVLATQNPIEQEGTYPLPEAQQDRFMFKILVPYPSWDEEYSIMKQGAEEQLPDVRAVLAAEDILELQNTVRRVPVADYVIHYAMQLGRNSRAGADAPAFAREWIRWGIGPRACRHMLLAARARALLHGRDHVAVQDVNAVAAPVMRHRLVPTFTASSEGIEPDDIVDRLIGATPARQSELSDDEQVQELLRPGDSE